MKKTVLVALVLLAFVGPLQARSIGVVGCSNTVNAVGGALQLGASELWGAADTSGYGGGNLAQWAQIDPANRNVRWGTFEAALANNLDTTEILWQLCLTMTTVTSSDRPAVHSDQLNEAVAVLAEIFNVYDTVVGGTPNRIHVIGLPHFTDTCTKGGGDGDNFLTAISAILANSMAGSMLPTTQPVSGRLPDVGPGDVTASPGGCHRNNEAKLEAGQWIIDKLPQTVP